MLSQAALVPTHRRDVQPVWQAAVRFLLKLQHPQVLLMLLNHSYMGLKQIFPRKDDWTYKFQCRLTEWLGSPPHCLTHGANVFRNHRRGGMAYTDPLFRSQPRSRSRKMQLIRCEGGQLCVWHPSERTSSGWRISRLRSLGLPVGTKMLKRLIGLVRDTMDITTFLASPWQRDLLRGSTWKHLCRKLPPRLSSTQGHASY